MNQEHYPVYLKFTFILDSKNQDFLIAKLVSLGFESFEEHEHELDGYIREAQWTDPMHNAIKEMKGRSFHSFRVQRLLHQNWNAQWESNFKPILIGSFCGVRATFHDPLEGVEHELTIDPKMAFGTGHHETTWMMISEMEYMDLEGKTVLDYGAGTGILAILAEKLGATQVDALEVDLQAVENILLNLDLNNSAAITCLHGDINDVKNTRYDIVLANINRSVILESLDTLYHMVVEGGQILFSGILAIDRELVEEKIMQAGFQMNKILQRGEWICMHTEK